MIVVFGGHEPTSDVRSIATDVVRNQAPTSDCLSNWRRRNPGTDEGLRGIVVDARDTELKDDLLLAVANLKRPLIHWLTSLEVSRPHGFGVAVLLRRKSDIVRLEHFAARVFDLPSFWFALGFHLVADGEGTSDDPRELVDSGVRAIERLAVHPLVARSGARAEALFGNLRVDDLHPHRFAFERRDVRRDYEPRGNREERLSELRIVVPTTYQIEGGVSVELPVQTLDAVLRHVVVELTADRPGSPNGSAGATVLPGSGWWFSPGLREFVHEAVSAAYVCLRIEREQVASLSRYLRLAWLQDCVFCTLDGVVVEA